MVKGARYRLCTIDSKSLTFVLIILNKITHLHIKSKYALIFLKKYLMYTLKIIQEKNITLRVLKNEYRII